MSEHAEQAALFEWAARAAVELPALRWLFAIPNGGLRHPAVAVRMVEEGLRAGVPDVFLPVPRWLPNGDCLHGLFIELKVKPNKPTPQQNEWIAYLSDAGYQAVVCYGMRDAARVILDYLDVAETDKARLVGDAYSLAS